MRCSAQSTCQTLLLSLLSLILLVCNATPSGAHFVWVIQVDGEYRIVFGERPEAEAAEMLKAIEHIQANQSLGATPLKVKLVTATDSTDGWLACLESQSNRPLSASVTYGVVTRGGTPFLMHYLADYVNLAAHEPLKTSAETALQIIPQLQGDEVILTVYQLGQPAPNCEIVIQGQEPEAQTTKTDANGQVRLASSKKRLWIRAKRVEVTPGKYQDQDYADQRFYATLVLDPFDAKRTLTAAKPRSLPDLPMAITSFGAATCRGQIFVYGGHTGNAHEYAHDLQNPQLMTLDLSQDPAAAQAPAWKMVTKDEFGVQGNALVAHGDQLYKLGGLQALNGEGEAHKLASRADFHRFDFENNKWLAYPSLPQPRSSFDAVVIENTLYVVGGWNLQVDQETEWCENALAFDLSQGEQGQWNVLATPPFKKRALAVGQLNGELVVMGGMNSDGKPTTSVHIFSPQQQSWREASALPGNGPMEGFGVACHQIGDKLIACTHSGAIYSFEPAGSGWKKIDQLPNNRFFSRLVPIANQEYAILGGADMESGKHLDVIVRKLD